MLPCEKKSLDYQFCEVSHAQTDIMTCLDRSYYYELPSLTQTVKLTRLSPSQYDLRDGSRSEVKHVLVKFIAFCVLKMLKNIVVNAVEENRNVLWFFWSTGWNFNEVTTAQRFWRARLLLTCDFAIFRFLQHPWQRPVVKAAIYYVVLPLKLKTGNCKHQCFVHGLGAVWNFTVPLRY